MFTTIAQERNATAPFWMKVSREARLESFKFALKRATSFTSSGCLARSSLVMAVPCSSFLSSSFRLSDSVDYLGKSPPLTSFQFSCTTSALSFCLVYASHDWDRQTPLIVRLLTVIRFFYSVTCNSETLTFWNIIYGYLENNTVCRLDNGTLNRIRDISVVHPSTKRSVFWMSQWDLALCLSKAKSRLQRPSERSIPRFQVGNGLFCCNGIEFQRLDDDILRADLMPVIQAMDNIKCGSFSMANSSWPSRFRVQCQQICRVPHGLVPSRFGKVQEAAARILKSGRPISHLTLAKLPKRVGGAAIHVREGQWV